MSKLIVIAGIKRSGSTWLYNAVRLCLIYKGKTVHIAGDGTNYDERCGDDYQIVKRHPYEHEWADRADYIFTSDRGDDGIRGSLNRAFGSNLTDHRLRRMRNDLRRWRMKCAFHADYERIIGDKKNLIKGIAEVLELKFDVFDVECVFNELESVKPPAEANYDPVTMLFKNHITSL